MGLNTCLRCGHTLLRDPTNRHWSHCPTCSPEWHAWAVVQYTQAHNAAYAKFATTDSRGNPTRGGKKI